MLLLLWQWGSEAVPCHLNSHNLPQFARFQWAAAQNRFGFSCWWELNTLKSSNISYQPCWALLFSGSGMGCWRSSQSKRSLKQQTEEKKFNPWPSLKIFQKHNHCITQRCSYAQMTRVNWEFDVQLDAITALLWGGGGHPHNLTPAQWENSEVIFW